MTEHSKIAIENDIKSLNLLINMVFVSSTIGRVERTKTIKVGNTLKEVDEPIDYTLKKYNPNQFNKKKYLLDNFFQSLNEFEKIDNTKFKYFKKNFFERIFFKRKQSLIIDKIKSYNLTYSWLIVSQKILDIIRKDKSFVKIESENNSYSILRGRLDNFNVFLNDSQNDDKVYFGNYDSAYFLVNQNSRESIIEYSFIQTGDIFILDVI
jgi:hypothetical protein